MAGPLAVRMSVPVARALASNPVSRNLVRTALAAGTRVADGVRITASGTLGTILRRIALALGLTATAEWLIPDTFFDLFDFAPGTNPGNPLGSPLLTLGAGQTVFPGTVTKTWTANGINFVRLADGRMGAQRKTGEWRFWRPKKPIVLHSSGSSNLRTLLRADKAVDRQMKRLEKAIRRRNPPRRRAQTPRNAPIIVETGPGSVKT